MRGYLLCSQNKHSKNCGVFQIVVAAKQNQKFPFHFFFRVAAEGWGEETQEKCKEIFGFARASPRRVPAQSGRMLQFRATTHAERAK